MVTLIRVHDFFLSAFDRVLCHARSMSVRLIVSTSFSHKLLNENVCFVVMAVIVIVIVDVDIIIVI